MDTMECPKCHAPMRTYERNGIHVDQCTECRGVFLDRGELDHLISLEAAQSEPAPVPAPTPPVAPQPAASAYAPQPQPQGYPQQGYPQQGYQQGYGGKPYKKRKNFLEELFD
jgi:Zn-finger nucleic acid-binding protein